MFDLLIRNANVVDGTGKPGFAADLAVIAGRIAEVGPIPAEAEAAETVDAKGLTLTPGFIDIHTHADIALLARPEHLPKVMQGVTTEVFTNCGLGFAPCTPEAMRIQRDFLGGLFGDDSGVDWAWRSVGELLDRYEKQGAGTNIAYLIPHGSVRVSVMGMEARAADSGEIERMTGMIREGIDQGAWGLSTGLWYSPMCFADRAENVAVCRAAGIFATHQRDYGSNLLASTQETVAIAEEAGVPVQLSHLQLGSKAGGGASNEILGYIDSARSRGVDITYDSYPYGAGSTMVQALLPTWASEGGPEAILRRIKDADTRARIVAELAGVERDWNRTHLIGVNSAVNRPYEMLSFREIAGKRGLTVPEFICRVLEEDELKACFIAYHTSEPDVRAILAHPSQMVGSDGLHLPGKTHPRLYGTFPRVLSEYVREHKVVSIEEAVRKMTSAPASRLGINDRGTIAAGQAADLVLFDPATIRDTATYDDPLRYPEGIPHVWVNGVAVKRDGQPTRALPGKVLRKR